MCSDVMPCIDNSENKLKRKLKRKEGKAKKAKFETVEKLGVDQQVDLFASLFRKYPPTENLSSLEYADLDIPRKVFLDVVPEGTFVEFVKKHTLREDLASSNKDPGRPHTLILASSAIRVADLTREFKEYKPVKLFGKEKISKQAEQLKQRVAMAIGVPARTMALLEEGSLKTARLEQIYIDYSHRDEKKRGILQIPETARDLIKLLNHKNLRDRLGECKLVLF